MTTEEKKKELERLNAEHAAWSKPLQLISDTIAYLKCKITEEEATLKESKFKLGEIVLRYSTKEVFVIDGVFGRNRRTGDMTYSLITLFGDSYFLPAPESSLDKLPTVTVTNGEVTIDRSNQ